MDAAWKAMGGGNYIFNIFLLKNIRPKHSIEFFSFYRCSKSIRKAFY